MKKTLLFIAVFASLSAIAQIPTTGLIAHYPFTGNASDASGNNLNGAVYSASLTTDRFGKLNSAYSFNGTSNYIEVADNNLLDLTGSVSISLWFEMGGASSGSTRLLDKGVSSTNDGYIISADTNGYSFIGGSIGTVAGEGASHKKLQLNQWYNVITVFKNDTVRMYLNGQLDTSYAGTSPMTATASNLRIGTANPVGAYFTGKIDDIRIYSSVLSPANISALYNENLCYQTITVADTLIINGAVFLGFNPITYQHTIKVFPNPTKDHITINYGSNYATLNGYTVKILNSLSQQVFNTILNNTQSSYINLNTWSGNGIYFVHLIDTNGNTVDVKKIVLQ